MTKEELINIIHNGETSDVEFKSAAGGFPGSFWDTYSAFANTEGGIIVLGVKEKNGILFADGLTDDLVVKYKKEFWSNANNTKTVNVNLLTEDDVQTQNIKGGHLLIFHIPQADITQRPVYRTEQPFNGTFKRNFEGDFKCTEQEVRRMYADADFRCSADCRILRGYTLDDIDKVSIDQYRRLFDLAKPNHPWLALDDKELLTKLGGYRKDRVTGEEGLTLAALLMFGKWQSIKDIECAPNFFPDYRYYPEDQTKGSERWTDRICPDGLWESNLFQFYRRVLPKLTAVTRHPFKLDEDTRIDETTAHVALREALINLCVHADYTINASLNVIHYPDRIILSNPGTLLVTRQQYYRGGESVCRNNNLQLMFSMLGKAEKAGSGVDKILLGWKDNNWSKPEISYSFRPDKVTLTLSVKDLGTTDQVSDQVSDQASDQAMCEKIVEFCKKPKSLKEIMDYLNMKNRTYLKNTYITPLLGKGLKMTHPERVNHPNQKYVAIEVDKC